MKDFYKMKFILILPLFFSLICVQSCVESQREVQNNLFYSSSNPKLSIRLNPNFKYLGKFVSKKERLTTSGTSVRVDREVYVFGCIDKNNIINKVVLIDIYNIPQHVVFLPDNIFSNEKDILVSGNKKIYNADYKYAVTLGNESKIKELQTVIKNAKHLASPCYMRVAFANVLSSSTLFCIQYLEDIFYNEKTKTYKCNEWEISSILDNEQRIFLKDFIINSEKAFQVSENNAPFIKEKDASAYEYDITGLALALPLAEIIPLEVPRLYGSH